MATMKLIEKSLTIEPDIIRQYSDITQDYNPIHLDPQFAATTPMKDIIAHGTMSMNLIWASLAETLGITPEKIVHLDLRFVKAVKRGTTVTSGGEQGETTGSYQVWVKDEVGDTVIQGSAWVAERYSSDAKEL